VTNKL